jgi:hypothetical protein
MSIASYKSKKHHSEVTAEYRLYWQPVFDSLKITNPLFTAKLCYMGKEFPADGARVPVVRLFPSELNAGQDFYTELFDWDQNHYEPMNRQLYRLKHNPNWKSETDRYVEASSEKMSTYIIRLSDFELVNSTSATASGPEIQKDKTTMVTSAGTFNTNIEEDPFDEDLFSSFDKEDDHYSKMTIRDLYCVMQNTPMSNKKWLNTLITEGKKWQQKP